MSEMEQPVALPELVEGTVDATLLEQLVRDLTSLTTIQEIHLKGGAASHAERSHVGLPEAVDLLVGGQLRGLQVRYLWQNVGWIDTLLRTPGGIKIVRTKEPTFTTEANDRL